MNILALGLPQKKSNDTEHDMFIIGKIKRDFFMGIRNACEQGNKGDGIRAELVYSGEQSGTECWIRAFELSLES